MHKPRAALVVVVLALAGTSCSAGLFGDDGDARADTTAVPEAESGSETDTGADSDPVPVDPEFAEGPCGFDAPLGTEPRCGTVTVPMNWDTGEGEISLAVAVFSADTDNPALDPVVYLEGGPGGHALESLRLAAAEFLDPLLARGDVVVFDQRGVGLSEPRLDCEEVTAHEREIEDIAQIDRSEENERFHTALAACSERLTGEGIDLGQFNTVNNAHDVDAIRQALGYDQWNLYGISYGTKLGLEVMRQHPDGVRTAVLDSVYPPQVDSVLDNPASFVASYEAVVGACDREEACVAGGDLGSRLRAVAQELDAEPVQVEVQDLLTGETDDVYADGETLVGVVSQALYSPLWFTDLPELVADLEAGQTRALTQFLSQQRTLEQYFTSGMFYAVTCTEEVPFADPAEVEPAVPPDPFGLRDGYEYGSNIGTGAFGTCEAFGSGSPPAGSNEAVASDVPTLLMAGAYDPVTPVAWAEAAAATLPESFLVVAPGESHGVSPGECGMGIVREFLDDPSSEPDATCLDEQSWQFAGVPEAEAAIELEEATYEVPGTGATMSVVRPADWDHGQLPGDSYRQASFLDVAQIVQVVGDPTLALGLEFYVAETWDIQLSDPVDRPGILGRDWQYRQGEASGVAVEWYQTEIGGHQVYVLLVSDPAELDHHVSEVLLPALEAIDVTETT